MSARPCVSDGCTAEVPPGRSLCRPCADALVARWTTLASETAEDAKIRKADRRARLAAQEAPAPEMRTKTEAREEGQPLTRAAARRAQQRRAGARLTALGLLPDQATGPRSRGKRRADQAMRAGAREVTGATAAQP